MGIETTGIAFGESSIIVAIFEDVRKDKEYVYVNWTSSRTIIMFLHLHFNSSVISMLPYEVAR